MKKEGGDAEVRAYDGDESRRVEGERSQGTHRGNKGQQEKMSKEEEEQQHWGGFDLVQE